MTKKRQQWKRALSRSFAERENRKDGRTASWASLRSGLGGRRGRTFLFTCTRARFGRGGARRRDVECLCKKNNKRSWVDLRLEREATTGDHVDFVAHNRCCPGLEIGDLLYD